MAGDEGDGVVDVAMRDGNARIAQTADPGGDAGHDAEGNTGLDQRQRFFPAASEDEGIAAFQTQDALARPGQFHQTRGDVPLFRARLAATLAGIFQRGAGIGEFENGFVHQRVIDHMIGLAQRIQGMKREKAGIAGPCPHQPDPAGFQLGQRKMRGGIGSHAALLPPSQRYDLALGHFTSHYRGNKFNSTIACKYKLVPPPSSGPALESC